MIRGELSGRIAAAGGAAFPARSTAAGAAIAPTATPPLRGERRAAAGGEARPTPFPMGPALLAAFFVSLMIPGSFALGGFALSPYRVILLVAFVPLALHWVRGRAGPIGPGDIGILLYCLWIWVSLFANHGLDRVHTAGIQFAEMFGGYLIGRTLIQNGEDFARFVRYLFYALLFLLPLALIELLTGFSPLRAVFQSVLAVEERRGNMMPRLGFRDRVQGPFTHSIHFGLFCSLAVANVFYHYRGTIVRRMGALGIAVMLTVTSLSSAPVIAAGLQLGMIAWDRVLAFLSLRWVILGGGAVLVLGGFQLLYPGGLLGFVIENLIFIPLTGYARIEVFEFGIQSVYDHPFFGIGYNDWERAFWMGHPTMDNYWLFVAVHYGVPSLLLFWSGIGLNMLRAVTNGTLDAQESAQRVGYLTALVGLVLVLGTVALWGAMNTFVLTYIGAGAWFAARKPRPAPGAAGTEAAILRPSQARMPAGPAAAGPAHPSARPTAEPSTRPSAEPSTRPSARPWPSIPTVPSSALSAAPSSARAAPHGPPSSPSPSPPARAGASRPGPSDPTDPAPPPGHRRPTLEDRIRAARARRQA